MRHIRQVVVQLHHILEACAGGRQSKPEIVEGLEGLGAEVVDADQLIVDVEAELTGSDDGGLKLTTKNVQALTLSMPPGRCPLDIRKKVKLEIDDQELEAPKPLSDRWNS